MARGRTRLRQLHLSAVARFSDNYCIFLQVFRRML